MLGHFLAAKRKVIRIEETKVLAMEQMISSYRPAGSCMMAPSPKEGVVDERLRVHVLKNPRDREVRRVPPLCRGGPSSRVFIWRRKDE